MAPCAALVQIDGGYQCNVVGRKINRCLQVAHVKAEKETLLHVDHHCIIKNYGAFQARLNGNGMVFCTRRLFSIMCPNQPLRGWFHVRYCNVLLSGRGVRVLGDGVCLRRRVLHLSEAAQEVRENVLFLWTML